MLTAGPLTAAEPGNRPNIPEGREGCIFEVGGTADPTEPCLDLKAAGQ